MYRATAVFFCFLFCIILESKTELFGALEEENFFIGRKELAWN